MCEATELFKQKCKANGTARLPPSNILAAAGVAKTIASAWDNIGTALWHTTATTSSWNSSHLSNPSHIPRIVYPSNVILNR